MAPRSDLMEGGQQSNQRPISRPIYALFDMVTGRTSGNETFQNYRETDSSDSGSTTLSSLHDGKESSEEGTDGLSIGWIIALALASGILFVALCLLLAFRRCLCRKLHGCLGRRNSVKGATAVSSVKINTLGRNYKEVPAAVDVLEDAETERSTSGSPCLTSPERSLTTDAMASSSPAFCSGHDPNRSSNARSNGSLDHEMSDDKEKTLYLLGQVEGVSMQYNSTRADTFAPVRFMQEAQSPVPSGPESVSPAWKAKGRSPTVKNRFFVDDFGKARPRSFVTLDEVAPSIPAKKGFGQSRDVAKDRDIFRSDLCMNTVQGKTGSFEFLDYDDLPSDPRPILPPKSFNRSLQEIPVDRVQLDLHRRIMGIGRGGLARHRVEAQSPPLVEVVVDDAHRDASVSVASAIQDFEDYDEPILYGAGGEFEDYDQPMPHNVTNPRNSRSRTHSPI